MPEKTQKETTPKEKWKEIGQQTRKVQHELNELDEIISESIPISVYKTGFEQIDLGLAKLRSDLYSKMSEDHPEQRDSEVFYGSNPQEDSEC